MHLPRYDTKYRWSQVFDQKYDKNDLFIFLDHLQPSSIFISRFSSKIENLYYRGGFAPIYACIIEFLYL